MALVWMLHGVDMEADMAQGGFKRLDSFGPFDQGSDGYEASGFLLPREATGGLGHAAVARRRLTGARRTDKDHRGSS